MRFETVIVRSPGVGYSVAQPTYIRGLVLALRLLSRLVDIDHSEITPGFP